MSSTNTFGSMLPNMKDQYADKKKERFGKTKKLMQSKGKATAEADASRDPMGFMERNKNMSLKGKKGVAF